MGARRLPPDQGYLPARPLPHLLRHRCLLLVPDRLLRQAAGVHAGPPAGPRHDHRAGADRQAAGTDGCDGKVKGASGFSGAQPDGTSAIILIARMWIHNFSFSATTPIINTTADIAISTKQEDILRIYLSTRLSPIQSFGW